jgi:hypothetical protein
VGAGAETVTTIREALKRLFQSPVTPAQTSEVEREQRVAARDRVDYSYTIFWAKTARLWEAEMRSTVLQNLNALIQSSEFAANPFERRYTLAGVEGSHSGASFLALQKVLQALREE